MLASLLKIAVLLGLLMTAAAYLVLVERWIAAWVQDRLGPNRVGVPLTGVRLFGLGQPVADGVKFMTKGEFTPSHVDRILYALAPIVIFAAAVSAFAVVPLGAVAPPRFWSEWFDVSGPIALSIAPGLDMGIVYIFAVGSVAVYGVVLGGWASNNKYSFFGAIRSSAQLISYEIPLGLGILGVILVGGSLRLDEIVLHQARSGAWNVVTQPLGFVVFCVAAFAEAARLPFDLPEAEQELVGGYHTEYLGIKLMLFMVAEFLHMVLAAFLIVILFLGGWHLWGLTGSAEAVAWPTALLRAVVLLTKVMAVILFFMFARWSWPRFRYDQLMNVAWKVMIPWGMINVVVVAAWMEYGGELADWMNMSNIPGLAIVGWGALLICWLATSIIDPTATDNKPRPELPHINDCVGQVPRT
ncbi:MAG: NADH-quinone oxidoreductase subunit H [Pirellulales bacterium]|nr:NADH-quinone oxidoreductase subunit H [Pirellulales bacterium]